MAAKLPGCDMFTVVVGNNIKGLTKDEMHAAAIEKLKRAVPILEKHKRMIIVSRKPPPLAV